MAGDAAASSFVMPAEVKGGTSPSIVVLGGSAGAPAKLMAMPPPVQANPPDPARETLREARIGDMRRISPSIIALGEPPVAFEYVAAIDSKRQSKSSRPKPLPMVIRGGVVSSPSYDPAPAQAVVHTPRQEVVEAPARSANPAGDGPRQEIPAPQPAAPPPPNPSMPKLAGPR